MVWFLGLSRQNFLILILFCHFTKLRLFLNKMASDLGMFNYDRNSVRS